MDNKAGTVRQYLYKHLFLDGEDSDLTIVVLGQKWRLHKAILCQSDYFRAMFNGSWIESDKKLINIDIADANINMEALRTTFGSMYKDDMDLDPATVVGVLAAATLFCLNPLIERCTRLMVKKISSQTAGHYHAAGKLYGQPEVERSCVDWLEWNLMYDKSADLDLMKLSVTFDRSLVFESSSGFSLRYSHWVSNE
jgi:BTB/POZ domain-containing protein 13